MIHIYVQHLLSAPQPLPSQGTAHFLFRIIPRSPPTWIDYCRRHSASPFSFLARRSGAARRHHGTGKVSLQLKKKAEKCKSAVLYILLQKYNTARVLKTAERGNHTHTHIHARARSSSSSPSFVPYSPGFSLARKLYFMLGSVCFV